MAGESSAGEQLFVVNTVRRWQTRGLRRKPGGKRSKFNLILCGGKLRLLRGKSRPLPRELLEQFEQELADRMRRGEIDIRVGGPFGPSVGATPEKEVPRDTSAEAAQAEGTSGPAEGEAEPEAEEEELEEVDEEEDEELEDEPEEDALPEPPKPLDRMNKAELVEYAVQVTGMSSEELEPLVKRDILEAIQGALEGS